MAGVRLLNARARKLPPTLPVEITDLSHDGKGVAHLDGKAVFIDDALPGETVEWVRTKSSRTLDEGRLTNVVNASPHRVVPGCIHFGICGGCALQHLAGEQQLHFKQQQLLESLTRIGHVSPESILPPLQAGQWHYRRRARLAARWVPKKQRTVVGFRERSSSFIADLKRCEILAPPVGDLVEPLSLLISSMSVRAKVPQIEVAVADHAVALVIRILDALTPEDRQALEAFELAHSVEIYLQPGGYDTIAPLRERPSVLEYRLDQFDIAVQFQPTDFVQVNGPLNSLMVERAVQLLKPTANDRVLDLFCGLGNFSLPLARSAAHVTGVEGEAGLVRRARENAQRNKLDNTEFYVANLAEPNRESAWAKAHYDKVLLDPPRAGAREVLDVVARSGAASVLYISCHPGSLARDAGVLVQEHGFKLVSAGVMDMFPHTAHIESMALFERAS